MARNSLSHDSSFVGVPQLQVGPSTPWVRAAVVRRLLIGLSVRVGVGRAELLRELGLQETFIDRPDTLIPASVMRQLWSLAEELTQDPVIGHRLGEHAQPYFLAQPGTTTLAASFLDASVGIRASASGYEIGLRRPRPGELSVRNAENVLLVELEPTQPLACGSTQEELCLVGNLVALVRQGSLVEPLEVHYRHQAQSLAPYRELFEARLQFATGHTALAFDVKDLTRSWPSAPQAAHIPVIDSAFDDVVPSLDETLDVLQEAWRAQATSLDASHTRPDIATFDAELGWLLTAHYGSRHWVS